VQITQPAVNRPTPQYAFTQPDSNPYTRNKVINPALNNTNQQTTAASRSQQDQQDETLPEGSAENRPPVVTHRTQKPRLGDYVAVQPYQPNAEGIENISLNVSNVTDAVVDLAVVDVEYFDAAGRFKTGQTFYVKNIPVNETVPVKVPEVNNAVRIKYRLSLVSVEQKGVYLVAE
jgi:hypothetical protein